VQEPAQLPPASITEFTGPVIKVLREQRGLTLQNVADITKISARHIQHIEEEAFAKLPPRPYLRGFLAVYAKALGYEPEKLINDYMKRYDAAIAPKAR
jgi:cytoskeletal protein RodZ